MKRRRLLSMKFTALSSYSYSYRFRLSGDSFFSISSCEAKDCPVRGDGDSDSHRRP